MAFQVISFHRYLLCLCRPLEGLAQKGLGNPGSPVLHPFPPFLGRGVDEVTGTVKGE